MQYPAVAGSAFASGSNCHHLHEMHSPHCLWVLEGMRSFLFKTSLGLIYSSIAEILLVLLTSQHFSQDKNEYRAPEATAQ
jgi:hypothetical protein